MDDIFKCGTCGADTDLAHPTDPKKTICHDCCEDHEYEYNSCAEWPQCIECGDDAPDDYYQESCWDDAQ